MGQQRPTFLEERRMQAQGYRLIAGVDEVGRGALAGPVLAAAVIMPARVRGRWVSRVRDSKQLTPAARESLFPFIQKAAVAVGIGFRDSGFIDSRGIAPATRLAMKDAIESLSPSPDYVLIDYLRLPEVALPQKGVTDGDSICFSIACASIIAKVTRDRIMVELDGLHPGYGLARHKGYCTEGHVDCLARLGPSPIHRRSFQPVGAREEED